MYVNKCERRRIVTKGVRTLQKTCYKSFLRLKRSSPTILSYIGAAGVVATAVMAVKATPEAIDLIHHDSRLAHDGDPYEYTKLEAIKSAWRCYIPAATIGLSTLACILGANALNKRQQAALTSAYVMLSNAYKEYKSKTNDMFGEDSDISITKGVVRDRAIRSNVVPSGESHLFYEYNYGEFFERRKEDVLSAEYHFNLMFTERGFANLNDFYKLLDLPCTDEGELLGWSRNNDICDYPWVDFEHEPVELEDGMECCIINLPIPPTIDYLI